MKKYRHNWWKTVNIAPENLTFHPAKSKEADVYWVSLLKPQAYKGGFDASRAEVYVKNKVENYGFDVQEKLKKSLITGSDELLNLYKFKFAQERNQEEILVNFMRITMELIERNQRRGGQQERNQEDSNFYPSSKDAADNKKEIKKIRIFIRQVEMRRISRKKSRRIRIFIRQVEMWPIFADNNGVGERNQQEIRIFILQVMRFQHPRITMELEKEIKKKFEFLSAK
ncbi:14758_t:CDS:2 [Funneliformis caledonium]|uniref:14758_t:CDS:1 n=1 Tax=Funneliformis caledonium TaxID=1117310 RepID=A0A9N8VRV4_9GLOM|nr:14758_t:CDS:2 [Funneliformis caledonium]